MSRSARLHVFGVPGLTDSSGAPLRLRAAKQLGALLYLALEGRSQAVSRERLVDLLWDDVPEDRGRHSLAQCLSAIRGVLGRDALERAGDGVRLTAEVTTDLDRIKHEFDRLALTDPLAEAEWWAGSAFALWVEGARARLRRASVEALRDAVDALRRAGESARVHACAEVLYDLDPLSDTAVHPLAERALLHGDVVGAIQLLREHQHRVQEALGCTPHRDVDRLLRRLEAGAHPPVELVPARATAEEPQLGPAVFVAREKELAQLEAEWQRACRGEFRSCLVVGPGGIGKSALIRRFAATVAARAQPVFVITCQEIGQGIPFAAITDLVSELARDPSAAATDPRWLAEVARVHPGLRTTYTGIPEPPETPADSIRLRVAEGLLHMLEAVRDNSSLCMIFDDLQFMDGATRDILHILTRRLGTRGILIVETTRTPDVQSDLATPPFVSDALRAGTTLRVGPLDPGATAALVRAIAPSLGDTERPVSQQILRLSDGNPLFVELLVADWECHASASLAAGGSAELLPTDWTPPDTLRHAFTRLYTGLSSAAQQVLHVLAVARRALGIDELARCLRPHTADMDGTTLELLQRGIVRLEAGALCFKTEVHRAYVYYAVAPELRQVFHAKLGRALVSGAPTHGLRTLEAAEHLMKAGLAAEAAQALVAGAAAAARRGTLTEVEAAVRNVLGMGTHLGQGDQLRVVLAEAVSARGAHTECLQVLETIQPTSALSPRQRALCLVLRAQALQRTRVAGDAELRSATLKALDAARESGDSSVLATSIHVAVEAASELGDQVLIAELVSSSEALARDSVAPSTRGRALLTTAFCLMNSGSFEVARGAFSRAEELLREASLDAEVARAINGQAICLIAIGEHASALKRLTVGHRVAQGINDVHNESALMSNLGVVYEEVGMFSEARWCYRNAAAQERPLGVPRRLAMVFVNAASIELIHGDLTSAARDLSEARDAALKTGLWRLEVLVDLAEADFHLACGEPELAWPLVQRWMRHVPGSERGIDTNGRALRLLLQCFRATEGAERFHARLGQLRLDEKPLKLAERLEVRGYIYHALRNEGADTLGIGPVAIAETGLLGVLAALACVGIHLDGAPACYPQESAAAYVERTFPRDQRTVVLETPERLLTSR